jgi:hypothetical protein
MKYVKKPIIVDVFRWVTDDFPSWFNEAVEERKAVINRGDIYIAKYKGIRKASPGDYLVYENGEIYTYKPDEFILIYEPYDNRNT